MCARSISTSITLGLSSNCSIAFLTAKLVEYSCLNGAGLHPHDEFYSKFFFLSLVNWPLMRPFQTVHVFKSAASASPKRRLFFVRACPEQWFKIFAA